MSPHRLCRRLIHFGILWLSTAAFGLPTGWAQSTPMATHAPIVIDGDSDICDAADRQPAGPNADGILNCDSADGTPANPYRVANWQIQVKASLDCPGLPGTCRNPPCASTSSPAAISICQTNKTIVIENVDILNEEAVRRIDQGSSTQQTKTVYAAGVAIVDATNVRLDHVKVTAAGTGIAVDAPNRQSGRRVFVELHDVSVQSAATVPGSPGPAEAAANQQPLVDVAASDVWADGLTVEARTREAGMSVRGQPLDNLPNPKVAIERSFFGNASTTGLELVNVDASVSGTRFHLNGVPTPDPGRVNAGNLKLGAGTFDIRGNWFETLGYGISNAGRASGHIEQNHFDNAGSEDVKTVAIFEDSTGSCNHLQAAYNDMVDQTVTNGALLCDVDARFNWWNVDPGPTGRVLTEPRLADLFERLPAVNVSAPLAGTSVFGKIQILGTASAPNNGTLDHIEATTTEKEWAKNSTGEGRGSWLVVLDGSDQPLGPMAVWIRACQDAANHRCGVPARLDLVVVERPLPPIALLEASRRAVRPNEPVVFSANLSYSPEGRPLVAYRFNLGDGSVAQWSTSSTLEARYASAGTYAVTVDVQDADGLLSANVPRVLVHVRDEAGHAAPGVGIAGAVPGPGLAAAVLCLAGVAVHWRRRSPWP